MSGKVDLGEQIVLQKDDGSVFDFKVVNIYEKTDVTIVPLLPLIGDGARIFTELKVEAADIFLENKLSH